MSPRLHRIRHAFLAAPFVLLTAAAADAQVIDTRSGESIIGVIADPFGQTFTVPDGAGVLQGFSFWISTNGGPPGFTTSFEAFVMRWSGGAPTGPVLYRSGVQSAPACCAAPQVTFLTDELPVIAGEQYVAFLGVAAGTLTHRIVTVGGVQVSTYDDGAAVFAFGCVDGSPLACGWATQPSVEREFVASFGPAVAGPVPVPEPSGRALLFASGVGLMMATHSRRRRVWRVVMREA
jgi:hypothetical protein